MLVLDGGLNRFDGAIVSLDVEMVAVRVGIPEPSGEVKSSGWAKPEDALEWLSYAGERRVLRECVARRLSLANGP